MHSDSRFRSSDLWVMSPTRYRCAKSLCVLCVYYVYHISIHAACSLYKFIPFGVGSIPTVHLSLLAWDRMRVFDPRAFIPLKNF